MVSLVTSRVIDRVIDRRIKSWSGQAKDNKTGICCFSVNG